MHVFLTQVVNLSAVHRHLHPQPWTYQLCSELISAFAKSCCLFSRDFPKLRRHFRFLLGIQKGSLGHFDAIGWFPVKPSTFSLAVSLIRPSSNPNPPQLPISRRSIVLLGKMSASKHRAILREILNLDPGRFPSLICLTACLALLSYIKQPPLGKTPIPVTAKRTGQSRRRGPFGLSQSVDLKT